MFFNESYELNSINVEPTNVGITGDAAGAYRIIAESSEEWYTLREKMMRLEHTALVTEDAALLEAGVGSFFKKIAEFFKKMWAKVKELWQKFLVFVNQHTMNAKKFITKYEKILKNNSYAGFKFKGYRYPEQNLGKVIDGIGKLCADAITNTNSIDRFVKNPGESAAMKDTDSAQFTTAARKTVLSSADEDTFAKDVVEFLRGSDEAEELENANVDSIINTLKNGQKEISKLETIKKNTDKMYQSMIKVFEDASSKFYNATDKTPGSVEYKAKSISGTDEKGKALSTDRTMKVDVADNEQRKDIKDVLNKMAEKLRAESSVVNECSGLVIQVAKESLNQAKSVAAKMVTYKPQKNESFGFSTESILDRF